LIKQNSKKSYEIYKALSEIENTFQEEFGEEIFKRIIKYGEELFHDKLFITWSEEGVTEINPGLTEESEKRCCHTWEDSMMRLKE
jgi:hypothetical protein